MFFDAQEYDRECAQMSNQLLVAQLSHYDRRLSGRCTSAAIHTAAATVTLGATLAFVPVDGYLIRRAEKKRKILKRHIAARGIIYEKRLRDIMIPVVTGAAVGALTLGVAAGAETVAVDAMLEYGMAELVPPEKAIKVAAHVVLDSGVMMAEEGHAQKQRREAEERLRKQG